MPSPAPSAAALAVGTTTALLLIITLLRRHNDDDTDDKHSGSTNNKPGRRRRRRRNGDAHRPPSQAQPRASVPQHQQRAASGSEGGGGSVIMRSRFRSLRKNNNRRTNNNKSNNRFRIVCAPTQSEYDKCISHCVSNCIDGTGIASAAAAINNIVAVDDTVLVLCGTEAGQRGTTKTGSGVDGGVASARRALRRCQQQHRHRGVDVNDADDGDCDGINGGVVVEPAVFRGDPYDLLSLRECVASAAARNCSSSPSPQVTDADDDGDEDNGDYDGALPAVSIICIDMLNVYGNDLIADGVALIRYIRAVFQPYGLTTIIVKSRALARHAKLFVTFEDFMKRRDAAEVEHGSKGGKQKESALMGEEEDVQVICTIGVSDYRQTIPRIIVGTKGRLKHVLEIGCHHGKTTFLLAEAVAAASDAPGSGVGANDDGGVNDDNVPKVIGIDIGKVCIDRANAEQERRRKRMLVKDPHRASPSLHHAECKFEVGDAWDTSHQIQLDKNLNVIYLDVGGISGADGELEALALVRQLACAYAKSLRYIVVKSRCLRHHAATWVHSDDVLRERKAPGRSTRPTEPDSRQKRETKAVAPALS